MNRYEDIIRENYKEAVKGIREDFFTEANTKWYNYVVGLPEQLQITYLNVVLNNQVFNGGFHQYFVNGYGQFAKETIIALKSVKAFKKAELLNRAWHIVNYENHPEEIFREVLLARRIPKLFFEDDLFDPLDCLDSVYYSDEDEDITQLLGEYLQCQSIL